MSDIYHALGCAYRWFLEALFPPKCIICHQEGRYLCLSHQKFSPAPPNKVDFRFLDRIYAAVKYYDPISEKLISFLKFRGFSGVADIMADEIIKSVPVNFWKDAIIVPIPLHWMRQFWRGFNQTDSIAQALAKKIPHIKVQHILKRKKRTSQQARLSRQERFFNTQGAFFLNQKIQKTNHYILLDDVVASGATLESAAQTLKQSGVRNVEALVFARGGK
jgi:ComF family protein